MWSSCKLKVFKWYVGRRPIDVTAVDIGESKPLTISDVLLIESIQAGSSSFDHWIQLGCLVQKRTDLSASRIALLPLSEFHILASRVGKDIKEKIALHNKVEHAGWSKPLSDLGNVQ